MNARTDGDATAVDMIREDGTLSAEAFEVGVREILNDRSGCVRGRWVEETTSMVRATTANGYGVLESDFREETLEIVEREGDDVFDDDHDDAVVRTLMCGHVREYRIVYSATFCVPVLCVRARDATTRAAWTVSRLLTSLRRENPCVRTNDDDPVLTPYSNPHERENGDWACVHPCATAGAMRLLLADDDDAPSPRRYLEAWLRCVAREVSLALDDD